MAKSLQDILTDAAVVRDETGSLQNTAQRVGGVLVALADYLSQYLNAEDISVTADATSVKFRFALSTSDGVKLYKEIQLPLVGDTAGVIAAEDFANILSDMTGLNDRIMTESEARETADAELTERITAEEEARTTRDSEITSALNAETNARLAADKEEKEARKDADEEIINAINVEANARISSDQNLEARAKIIHDLGLYTSRDSLLAAAANINIVRMGDANDKRILFGRYDGGGNVVSVVIIQHNVRTGTTTGTGIGTTMQYVFDGKQRYTRYIDHTATAVTSVQSLQPDGVRNLYFTAKGFIGLRDMWGTQVGSGFFLPDNTAVREDAANITASAVGLITTSFLGTTKTSSLGAVTSARAGVMTVALYNELKAATKDIGDHYSELQQHLTAIYNRLSALESRIAELENQ